MIHPRRMTRRQLVQCSAGALLTAGLWPGTLQAEGAKETGEFYFLVVNDLHVKDKGCVPWLERVQKQMKDHAEKPEFLLLVGDLAEDGKPDQLELARNFCKGLGIPVQIVVGNHDYLTQTDRKAYEELFPGTINYTFAHRGWQFLGLDSTDGQKAKDVSIPAVTLQWLDDTLPKLDKKKPTVLFTHFPLGPLLPYRPPNAAALLERFKEYNLQAVYNGHFHSLTERTVGGVVLTTNKCCSFRRNNHDYTREKGYFLCHAKDGKIKRTFVEVKPA